MKKLMVNHVVEPADMKISERSNFVPSLRLGTSQYWLVHVSVTVLCAMGLLSPTIPARKKII